MLTVTVSGRAWAICCDPLASAVPREEDWPLPTRKKVGKGCQYIYADITPETAMQIFTHLCDYADAFIHGEGDRETRRDGHYCKQASQTVYRQLRTYLQEQMK